MNYFFTYIKYPKGKKWDYFKRIYYLHYLPKKFLIFFCYHVILSGFVNLSQSGYSIAQLTGVGVLWRNRKLNDRTVSRYTNLLKTEPKKIETEPKSISYEHQFPMTTYLVKLKKINTSISYEHAHILIFP